MRSYIFLLTILISCLVSIWCAAINEAAKQNEALTSLLDVDAGVESDHEGARQTRQFYGYYSRPFYATYYGGYGYPYYGGYGFVRPYYGGYYHPYSGYFGAFYG